MSTFKLQKLLNYRKILLEKEEAMLAKLKIEENEVNEKLITINNLINLKRSEMNIEQSIHSRFMYIKYIEKLEKNRISLNGELYKIRKKIVQQSQLLLQKYQEKEVVSNLKNRHQEEEKNYLHKKEKLEIEDIIMTRKAIEIQIKE